LEHFEKWYYRFHEGSGLGTADGYFAAKLFDALSHAANSHSHTNHHLAQGCIDRHTHPEIADSDHYPIGLLMNLYASVVTAGVTMNIRYRFLYNSKNGGLDLTAQPRKRNRLVLKGNLQTTPLFEAFDVHMQC
jgi:hypothetical protein